MADLYEYFGHSEACENAVSIAGRSPAEDGGPTDDAAAVVLDCESRFRNEYEVDIEQTVTWLMEHAPILAELLHTMWPPNDDETYRHVSVLLDVARVGKREIAIERLFGEWVPEQHVEAAEIGEAVLRLLAAELLPIGEAVGAGAVQEAIVRGPRTCWHLVEAVRVRKQQDAAREAEADERVRREQAEDDARQAVQRRADEQSNAVAHYRRLLELILTPSRRREWFDILEAAGLVAASDETVANPDGSRTVYRSLTCPVVTGLAITKESLELSLRPLLGQTLAAFQRAVPALALALGCHNLTARLGDTPGHIVLATHDRRVSLPNIVWRSRNELAERVSSREEAAQRTPSIRLPIGVLASGERFHTPPLVKVPHSFVVGSTGSGKTVWMTGTLAHLLTHGVESYVIDGKGSDYAACRPYVATVASQTWEHVVTLRHVYDVMNARTQRAEEMMAAGMSADAAYGTFHPILLMIDEWGVTRQRMFKAIGPSKKDHALILLDEILRLGRQPRVFVILGSQTARDRDIPNSWQENLGNGLIVGQPEDMSIEKAIKGAEALAAALELRPNIGKDDRGRAIVQTSGTTVSLCQTFYDFAPGRDWGTAPNEVAWRDVEQALSGPRLYPRRAPDLDELVAHCQTSDLVAATADLVSGTQDDWCELRMTTLDRRDATTGRFHPVPERLHLDPNSHNYVGRVRSRVSLDDED